MPVFINGKSAVHSQSGGVLQTTSVNMTGEEQIPVPYPNVAFSRDAKNTARRIFSNGQPLCHNRSYFAKSRGDEAGEYGGVFSRTVNGIAEFMSYSPNVYMEGNPAVRGGDLMVSNYRNTPPSALKQKQGTAHGAHGVDRQPDPMDDTLHYVMEWDLL